MSCTAVASGSGDSCANCGKQGSDTVKLKKCNACQLVKYCSVECQKAHRKQHKKACKKRSAELRDETLFGQGHDWPEEAFCPTAPCPFNLQYSNGVSFEVYDMLREKSMQWLLSCHADTGK
mmetsp:Transcript_25193/g.59939  ORF Transcript_25193/g.59939 Transcript_25193/m.59939 type:complete len:121 (+) Transcript_25193:536-898(+)